MKSNGFQKNGFTAIKIAPKDLTLGQIRDALSPDIFDRSYLKSFFWTVHDLVLIFGIFALTRYSINHIIPEGLYWPTILVYWFVQGTVATGIWIIAHECGHGAFSPSEAINDVVGLILHSICLVPYHAWKLSHSKHHRGTANMDRDVAFVPFTKQESEESIWSDAPAFKVLAWLFLGWPAYLLTNISGQKYNRWTSHFTTDSPIFDGKHNNEIYISNLGLIIFSSILLYISIQTSFIEVFIWYGGPYLIINAWIVVITYLHHTHPLVPHYREEEWTFVRGALATMDRDYGWLINYLQHHIGDTHVAHHLFPRIPHYNAVQAKQELKAILGPYYNEDKSSYISAFYSNFKECVYVPDDGDIVYFKKG